MLVIVIAAPDQPVASDPIPPEASLAPAAVGPPGSQVVEGVLAQAQAADTAAGKQEVWARDWDSLTAVVAPIAGPVLVLEAVVAAVAAAGLLARLLRKEQTGR